MKTEENLLVHLLQSSFLLKLASIAETNDVERYRSQQLESWIARDQLPQVLCLRYVLFHQRLVGLETMLFERKPNLQSSKSARKFKTILAERLRPPRQTSVLWVQVWGYVREGVAMIAGMTNQGASNVIGHVHPLMQVEG